MYRETNNKEYKYRREKISENTLNCESISSLTLDFKPALLYPTSSPVLRLKFGRSGRSERSGIVQRSYQDDNYDALVPVLRLEPIEELT